MKICRLTNEGRALFKAWLEQRGTSLTPPPELLADPAFVEANVFDVDIDHERVFATRQDFGRYVCEQLGGLDPKILLSESNDGMWDWLTLVYFRQFGRKASKWWHYTVARKGHSVPLAYRHLARTAFEMYWRHREEALVMLHVDMATWGDMAEQLTSRQNVAYHKGYIKAANALYFKDGRLRRGAASRVKPVKRRKAGDSAGKGAAGRLALAVRRLCRTFDTHALETQQLLGLLPREFQRFAHAS